MSYTDLPPRAVTAAEEFASLAGWLQENGVHVTVDFDGKGDEKSYSFRPSKTDLPEGAEARFTKIVDAFLSAEIGDWAEGKGGTGYVRIYRGEAWLDGDSRKENWSWERSMDDNLLDFADWDEEPDPSPA